MTDRREALRSTHAKHTHTHRTTPSIPPRSFLWLGLCLCACLMSACSGNQDAMRASLQQMEQRLQETEKSFARQSVRLEDVQDQVNLLNDKTETIQLAMAKRGLVHSLPVVVARPGGNYETGVSSPPTQYGSPSRVRSRPLPSNLPPRVDPVATNVRRISLKGTEPKRTVIEDFHSNTPSLPVAEGSRDVESSSKKGDGQNTGERVQITEEHYAKMLAANGQVDDRDHVVSANSASSTRRAQGGGGGTTRIMHAGGEASRPKGQAKSPVTTEVLPTTNSINAGKPINVQPPQDSTPSISTDNPMDVYKKALSSYRKGDYAHAFNEFKTYLSLGPSRDYLDNAYYWLGECSFGMGKHEQAISYFSRVIKETPGGNKVPDSMLKASLAYRRLGKTKEAKSTLYNLIETYPTTNAAKLAAEKLKSFE